MWNIYQVDAVSGATGQLLPFGVTSDPRAVAYDPTGNLIYWTDYNLHTINRYSLLTNRSSVIYHDPSNTGKDIGLRLTDVYSSLDIHVIYSCITVFE